ncbi:MAG: archease [Betaproteobacteria bacterium]|jgi:SHS2 domain-containing protein|nr:MAG: archease [Betaproteobacteria bacterium]
MVQNSTDPVGWEHFDHDADVGVRGIGVTQAQAFEQAALALTSIVTQIESVEPRQRIDISAENGDPELLFVDWLDALIFEMATRRMLFSRYKVDIEGERLSARAWGEPVDVNRHQPAVEIKGATLTELKVEEQDEGQWLAQCVVDV